MFLSLIYFSNALQHFFKNSANNYGSS